MPMEAEIPEKRAAQLCLAPQEPQNKVKLPWNAAEKGNMNSVKKMCGAA